MRLIDADVFEELFDKQIEYGATDIFDAVEDALQDTPIVDAVPVVRCKDCQYGDQNTCGAGYWCWKYGIGVSEEHFCAKGVKAKEERNESE